MQGKEEKLRKKQEGKKLFLQRFEKKTQPKFTQRSLRLW